MISLEEAEDAMTPPNAGRTARERARAELTREIKEEARRQLVTSGADGLSLRAVARELGMVSSALYRYFSSRDDLLTALIIDAYDAIGAAVEEAVAAVPPAGAPRDAALGKSVHGRWLAACRAVRSWARAHPHEYALIYGSPVPGYRAPQATIGPAARVPLALVGILRDAAASGLLASAAPKTLPGPLAEQAAAVAAALAAADGDTGPAVPADVLVRCVIAWTQLFGMVSFELFGQFVNSFEPTDALFEHAIDQMATYVAGIPAGHSGIAARSPHVR
jgi:AcrR family transcriptional regulator